MNDAVDQHSFQAFSQSRRQTSDITCSDKQRRDVSDFKTAKILFESIKQLIEQFLKINRLISGYFSQPYSKHSPICYRVRIRVSR